MCNYSFLLQRSCSPFPKRRVVDGELVALRMMKKELQPIASRCAVWSLPSMKSGSLSSRRVPVHSWFVHRASHRLRMCPPAVFASTSANAVRVMTVFHVSDPLVDGMLYCGARIRVVQWAPAMQVWLCLWIVSEEDSNLCMYPRTMS